MKGARPLIAVALGFLVVGLVILRGFADSSVENPIASVDNPAPRGLQGLALWLQHRGVDVQAHRLLPNPVTERLEGAVLFVPPPELERWEKGESEALLKVVELGAADLVVLCDEDPARQARLKPLLSLVDAGCETVDELEPGPRIVAGALPRWPARVLVRGAGTVPLPEDRLAFPAVLDAAERVIMARIPHGQGMVTVLGSASILSNDGLTQEGNAALAAALSDRRRAIFLEGHHKLRQARVIDAAFERVGPRVSIVAFSLAAFFILLGFTPRRGDPPWPRSRAADRAAEAAARGLATLFVEAGLDEAELDQGASRGELSDDERAQDRRTD